MTTTTESPSHLSFELRPLRVAAQRLLDGWPNASDLREARAAIDGEIARRAGSGIRVCEDGRNVATCPDGGASLHVDWCTSVGETVTWFATVDAAKAALLAFADGEHRAPSESGMYVDLTPQGCVESRAYVVDRASGGAS